MNENFGDVNHFYANYYQECLRTGFVGRAQDKTHKSMESPFSEECFYENVLEVGAGLGDHMPFVRHAYTHYTQTDIRAVTDKSSLNPDLASHHFEVANVMDLKFKDNSFNRSIATCLLLHLVDPERALQELRRVTLKSGGSITLLVPCEPGILLRLTRILITGRKAKKLGFDGYALFNARDHISYFLRIHRLIQFTFNQDKINISRKPFLIPSWNLNFYYVYQITLGDNK